MPATATDRLDGISTSTAVKAPCRLKTTANHALTGLAAIDGVTPVAGDRILVGSQTDAADNGIYNASSTAWSRAKDFDGTRDAVGGTQLSVTSGTDGGGTYWRVSGYGPVVIGTDDISFVPGAGDTAAGVSFLQSIAAGAFGLVRSVMDKLRDHLDLRDFTGADPTGLANSDTALQRATAEMIASGRPLRISRGDWLFTSSALSTASAAVLTDNIHIYGDGQGATRIVNHCVAKTPLFNIGNSRFATIRDLTITGNGLTGASGSGHAIDMTNPGTIDTDPYYPSHARLERLQILNHLGNATPYGGGTMPACAVYEAGGLGTKAEQCYFGNNGFGVYEAKSAQPTFDTCTFNGNSLAGLVNDRCENLRVVRPDCVGAQGAGAVLAVTGADGKIRVDAYGVQSAGGSLVKAGAITDFYGLGSEYHGGKHKNHVYAGFSLWSPHQPLVQGAYVRQEVDGTCGVFSAFGARTSKVTFALANVASGSISNRYGLWLQPQNGFDDIGVHHGNRFPNGGGGVSNAYGTAIFVDGSQAAGASISGDIDSNDLGDGAGAGSASTWAAFLRVSCVAAGLSVRNNHAAVGPNVTITTVYDYTGTTTTAEGLVDDNNSYLVQSGTVGTGKVQPTDYTGLQRTGYYNVVRLTVRGTQVVAGRVTGFGAMTGTATKTAIATYASPTISAGYVQAEVQAIADGLQAATRRLKALDDAARTHGLID